VRSGALPRDSCRVNKQHILNEIKRTAGANGGVPLGNPRLDICSAHNIQPGGFRKRLEVLIPRQ